MNIHITHGTSFSLLSVEIPSVVARYNRGEFSNVLIPKISKAIKKFDGGINQVLGESPENDMFSSKNRSGTGIVIATDNCTTFRHITHTVRLCNYCNRVITVEEPFQMIVDIQNSISPDANEKDSGPQVYGIDQFCSRECAYGGAILSKNAMNIYYTKNYYNVDGKLLKPKDPKLLNINGGSLTEEQWLDPSYDYNLQASVVVSSRRNKRGIFPTKRTYIRINQ
jgi:hypothetical protein